MSNRELSPAVEVVCEPREPEHLIALKEAKAKIAKPINWEKGCFYCYSIVTGQTSYCMLGALGWDPKRGPKNQAALDASSVLENVIGNGGTRISDFNDTLSTTHADVMAAFDLAIEQATRDWLVAR